MKYVLAIAIILILTLSSCTPSVRYIDKITVDTIKVVPPIIYDSILVKQYDTVVVAQRIVDNDTIIDVRYYPETKYITVKVKPDTVEVLRIDTVSVTQVIEQAKEKSYTVWNYIIALAIIVLISIFIWRKYNAKSN
jgi:allophanate hydrolase subunit 1